MIFNVVHVLLLGAILNPHFETRAETRAILNGFGETRPRAALYSHGKNAGRVQIWENQTLIYHMDEAVFSADERRVIYEGMEDLSNQTCALFKKRQGEVYFVNITGIGEGCWSHIGRIDVPAQELNLGTGCFQPEIVLHELMHALGFHHEHQRPCRDDYITINYDNINWEGMGSLHKRMEEEEELVDIGYDYESILHCDMFAYAINTSIPTFIPAHPGVNLGGKKLSKRDREKVKRLYKC